MENFIDKMKNFGVSEIAIKSFVNNLTKLQEGNLGQIKSSEIEAISSAHSELQPDHTHQLSHSELLEMAKKVCVIKLNGGLGTGMGLDQPKSQIKVRKNLNFLEICVAQIEAFRNKYQIQVPLVFMNSFSTHDLTMENLEKINFSNSELETFFHENKSPKVRKINQDGVTSYEPATFPENPILEWAPPGHADIYPSIYQGGFLDLLIDQGYEYIFVSNIDNLGSVFNLAILEKVVELDSPFVMEVANRTEMDKKGGHLAKLNGNLHLRESAQVSPEDLADFQDFIKYSKFNTNSIWIKTRELKEMLVRFGGFFDLPLIINEKNIDPTNELSEKIIQLETAMGSAISYFSDAKLILVPDFRFLPVKNTAQLLYLMSDAVKMTDEFIVIPDKKFPVHLESKYYKNVAEFNDRFKVIPSLKNCSSLKIKSDVYFNHFRELSGDVEL